MKVGDLVKLCPEGYPRYKDFTGVLIEQRFTGRWIVMVNGRFHSFVIDEADMELVA